MNVLSIPYVQSTMSFMLSRFISARNEGVHNMTVTEEEYLHPEYLVETEWLDQHFDLDDLRVFDCTVNVIPNPDVNQKKQIPFVYQSGLKNFEKAHIPRAEFIDVLKDLSDESSDLPLMLPPKAKFIEAMRDYGVNENSQIVLYSTTEPNWAARVWWMLRVFGFNNAAILNGGWAKWKKEGRGTSNAACEYELGTITSTSRQRTDLFVSKVEVLAAIGNTEVKIINALPYPMYTGLSEMAFGRKGRITGSVNVPFFDLHDPDTGCYLPAEKLHKKFDGVGVDSAEHIITYCGAGVAASNNAFALALLGYENVSIYDGSMFEWGNDASLPMEIG